MLLGRYLPGITETEMPLAWVGDMALTKLTQARNNLCVEISLQENWEVLTGTYSSKWDFQVKSLFIVSHFFKVFTVFQIQNKEDL